MTRLWWFDSPISDRGQWHEVEVARTMQRYVLVSRDFAGRPPRRDVDHLCVDRHELETTGRSYARKARTVFFTDAGREAEQRRMGEAA